MIIALQVFVHNVSTMQHVFPRMQGLGRVLGNVDDDIKPLT